jgi:thiamine biosynthesis lipoprotein
MRLLSVATEGSRPNAMFPSPSPAVAGLTMQSLHGHTMGTSWSVKLLAPTRTDPHALHEGIQAQLDDVVAQMSTWEPDSDIVRFNQAAAGTRHMLPQGFWKVLNCALEIARASDGAYDPTVGPLVAAWGFGAGAASCCVPDAAVLSAARARVGWQRLATEDGRHLRQPGGLQLDLSAIAKGYGVDCVARFLRTRGIAGALIEVGGELYGYGRKPDDEPWRVLVESSPDEETESSAPRVIGLDDLAIATSGDRWHWFEQDGQRYSHTLDPRSGLPVEHAPVAVTVISTDAMRADAWATALTVMGVDAGFIFAEQHGIAARFVVRAEEGLQERMTSLFEAHLLA